jgi:hypothetical protein
MPLFDLTTGSLELVASTTFADEDVFERRDLQAALKQDISLLGDDLLVVAEEFASFQDAHRRIDLLCVDKGARPVVIELKRTIDGGHMELQALRYAAMVSSLTLNDLVNALESHLSNEGQDPSEARNILIEFLDDGEEAVVDREVRLILVSAGFGPEITTTVLWLNEIHNTDIRCVRLTPYRVEGRLLINVEQLIPLPAAEEYTVQLRRQAAATRATRQSGQDWTQYIISTPTGTSGPLRKRWAILEMVRAVHQAGARPEAILEVLRPRKFRFVEGNLEGDQLREVFHRVFPEAEFRRWFLDDPIYDEGRTWIVSNQWGLNTVPTLAALSELAPDAAISFEPA